MTDDLARLSSPDGQLVSALDGDGKRQLETSTLPAFLPRQRWFGAKDSNISAVRLVPLGELEAGAHALVVADVTVGGDTQRYLLPVSAVWGGGATSAPVLAEISDDGRSGILVDGALDNGLMKALLAGMRNETRLAADGGTVVFLGSESLRQLADPGEPRALGVEQSNVSIAFGSSIILKLYRRLREGEQPDVEVVRFLSQVGRFGSTPEFLGEIQYRPASGEATTLAAAFAFVPNEGDAWSVVTDKLTGSLLGSGDDDAAWIGSILGQRTAEMHKALAVETSEPDFRVEPLRPEDVAGWERETAGEAEVLLARLQSGLASLPAPARSIAEDVLARRDVLLGRLQAGSGMRPSGGRSRIHGDYHLGQVLVTGRDVVIIDFEGEPRRSLPERRAKSSPLRDVAGMLRSFHYAAAMALTRVREAQGTTSSELMARAENWRQRVSADFRRSYREHIVGTASYPADPQFAQALVDLFLIHKAIYEIAYELANRPDWVEIPLSGVQDLLDPS